MSTDILDQPATPVAETSVVEDARRELYTYSTWVHVGPAAEECEGINEEEGTNSCGNSLHFHAWVRLPNQLQHREIREKALAAKARRVRQIRDPESDANVILEDEMDRLARLGDAAIEGIADELLAKDWWRDYTEAVADVKSTPATEVADGEEDTPGPYANVEDDQRRLVEIAAMPEEERPVDELESLKRHLTTFNEAVDRRQNEIVEPKRAEILALDIGSAIDRLRDHRIELDAMESFMHTYSIHSWLVGVLRHRNGPMVFNGLDEVRKAAPEVLEELKATIDDLEKSQRDGSLGKGS